MINSKISYFLEGNTNGRLVTTFKILYFVVKKRMAVWEQFSKFCVSLIKSGWPFGYNFEILCFAVKKLMAVWAQL